MSFVNQEQIDLVRNSSDIVEIISEYLPLTKKGKNYFGVCPFHDDHKPSMSVSPTLQIYTCFTCGASGNVFNFIMNYESVTFVEALKTLSNKAGVVLANFDIADKKPAKNDKLYEIYKLSSKYYINNLQSKEGLKAKKYLYDRSLSDDVVKEFQLGLALHKKRELTDLLLAKNYEENSLVDLGLTNQNDNGLNDVFMNRILFPYWDSLGNIIGYSGRIYQGEDQAKYINTKETPIFKKGHLLYNYHRAKEEARRKKFVILMEGTMDVIRAHAIGVKNVVASMGTSFTHDQAQLIKKLSTNIIICYDGDIAGKKATESCINELLKVDIKPKVIELTDTDPDEYILKNGQEAFNNCIEEAISYIDFKVKYYRLGKNFNDSREIGAYVTEILQYLQKEDAITREIIINKLSDEFNIAKSKLETNKRTLVNNQESGKIESHANKLNKYEKAERALLHFMLNDKAISRIYEKKYYFLPTTECRFLANEILSYQKKNEKLVIADFLTSLQNKEPLIKLVGEIEQIHYNEELDLKEIDDYIKVIKEYNVANQIERLANLMNEEMDLMKKIELSEEIRKLKVKE